TSGQPARYCSAISAGLARMAWLARRARSTGCRVATQPQTSPSPRQALASVLFTNLPGGLGSLGFMVSHPAGSFRTYRHWEYHRQHPSFVICHLSLTNCLVGDSAPGWNTI